MSFGPVLHLGIALENLYPKRYLLESVVVGVASLDSYIIAYPYNLATTHFVLTMSNRERGGEEIGMEGMWNGS